MSLLRHVISDEDASQPVRTPAKLESTTAPMVSAWRTASAPRPYQAELFVWSLLEESIIVYLPTGAGKTLVAALAVGSIAAENPQKRVVFLVDKIPLLHQQADALRRETGLQVTTLSGENRSRRAVLHQPFEVLVATAAVFSDCLSNAELHPSQFSLVVMDEAHHCRGQHPYVHVALHLSECPKACRPRQLCLTASPAGASTEPKTEQMLAALERQIGAALRSAFVRSADLLACRTATEFIWIDTKASQSMLEFNSVADIVLQSLTKQASDILGVEHLFGGGSGNHLSGWQALVNHAERTENVSLAPIAQVASIVAEAVEISSHIGDAHGGSFLRMNGASRWCDMPSDAQRARRKLCEWPLGENAPALDEVVALLGKHEALHGQEFRALVFVKTRSLARQLAEMFDQDRHVSHLRPRCLVGGGGIDGMRWNEQEPLLKSFRCGQTKLLVATAVAEEGLDVAACNLVVRMDGVCSFTSHVQSRGRARARQSTYVVVGSREQQIEFQKLQQAEENLQRVVHRKMEAIQDKTVQAVKRCVDDMMSGRDAHCVPASSAAPVVDASATDVASFLVHGLPSNSDDEILRVFNDYGKIVGCSQLHGPFNGLRPAGHSAIVQLRLAKRHNIQIVLRTLAGLNKGLWFQQAQPVDTKIDGTKVLTLEGLDLGILLGADAFAQQAEICKATAQVAEQQRAIILRFRRVDSRPGEAKETIKVRLDLSVIADFALIDLANADALYIPLQRPPRFFAEREDGHKKRAARCCMDAWPFGCGLVYRLRCENRDDLWPLVAMLERIGARICHASIADMPSSLDVLRLPQSSTGFPYRPHVASKVHSDKDGLRRRCTAQLTLLKAFSSSMSESTAIAGHGLNHTVLYALLYAWGEEPLLLTSMITPKLLRALAGVSEQIAIAALDQLVSHVRADCLLFEDEVELFEKIVEDIRASPMSGPMKLPPNHVLVQRARVTPTRLVFLPAEETLANRILRQFAAPDCAQRNTASGLSGMNTGLLRFLTDSTKQSSGSDLSMFLRVEFRDENGDGLNGYSLVSRMRSIFNNGLYLGDRHYQYLHWSNSQLRTGSLWLYASNGHSSCQQIRKWPFSSAQDVPKKPSKFASRLALFFSSSIPTVTIPKRQVSIIRDIDSADGKYCFTDGAGKISREKAQEVAQALGLGYTPSAFQIRYGGAKGVVAVYSGSADLGSSSVICTKPLELRKSMVKFDSPDESFEVISWSRYNSAALNQQIILLLAARGVPSHVFLELHEKALLEAARCILDEAAGGQRLRKALSLSGGTSSERPCLSSSASASTQQLRHAGVDIISEPFFASLLAHLYRWDVRMLRQKTSIPVSEGAVLLGIPDESSQLEYGQVFLQVSSCDSQASGGGRRTSLITGPVAIAKNPCLHPGDILQLVAVPCPALEHIVDCLVFPVRGPRPHPDETSGSDLDGDMYFCTWCKDLIPPSSADAMDYSPMEGPGEQEVDIKPEHMEEYFVNSTTSTSLGAIANAHKIHADEKGAKHEHCLTLAQLHSDAVDAPKTGKVVEMPRELVPNSYPAWMEKEDDEKETSIRDTLLQQLYDQCPQDSATISEGSIALDGRFVLEGHEHYLEDATRLCKEYNLRLRQLMRRFNFSSEAEVLTCTFERKMGGPKERQLVARMVQSSYDLISKHYREVFQDNRRTVKVGYAGDGLTRRTADWRQLKASAWYVAAYREPVFQDIRMLSFAWLVSDQLITIAQEDGSTKPGRQRLFEEISDSLATAFKAGAEAPADAWALADEMTWHLQTVHKSASVAPQGLEGFGVLRSKPRKEFCILGGDVDVSATARAVKACFPDGLLEIRNRTIHVASNGRRPELRVNCQSCSSSSCADRYVADDVIQRKVCGWLRCYPGLAAACFAIVSWSEGQPQPWPLTAVDACLLFVQTLEKLFQDADLASAIPAQAETYTWARDMSAEQVLQACMQPVEHHDALNKDIAHPGVSVYRFFSDLLELTRQAPLIVRSLSADAPHRVEVHCKSKEMQVFRVALLRAFQQLCVDRRVTNIINGNAAPALHSKAFQIRNVRPDVPLGQIEQRLTSLGLQQVRAWLDIASGPLPRLKIEVHGTQKDLAAAESPVKDLRRCLQQASSRLLTNWTTPLLVDKYKDDLLKAVSSNPVIIVKGSTGSGKSTGVPRMMLEDVDILSPKRIICTQPRRIGATSLAQRLATLCGCTLGHEVGYRIGGDSEVRPGRTQLIYETTAIAMAQFLQGDVPCTHLIVDEVHNRTIFDDILLAIVRKHALDKYANLKVLLMSAATDSRALSDYFQLKTKQPPPVVNLAGSIHQITEHYLDDIEIFRSQCVLSSNGITSENLAKFIWDLHKKKAVEEYKQQMADMTSMKDKKEGEAASSRFLVFLAGRGDITGLQGELYEIQDELGEQLDVKVLHAGIPVEKQMEAVESRSSGKRMIVLATDVVESSVTMPDVDVVIDSCLHKRKQWSAELREYQLRQELITKDEALQRRGRTGRLGPGEVYRLVTKQEFRRLVDHALPQMQTASISEVLLLLSDSPLVKDPREFLLEETLSPPAPRQVDEAMVKLQELGALEPQSGGLKPTNFGRMLQKLPLEPELGLLVWTGLRLGELEACEIMAGLVQRGLPFLSDASFPPDAVQQLVRLRRACSPDSDLLAGLRVYEAWQAFLSKTPQPTAAEEAQWCWSHYLSLNVLQEIEEMRTQIHNALAELGLASKIEDSLLKKMRERRRAHRQLTQTPKHQWLQDPAASLTKLLPPLSSQRPRHQLLRWCIALAFAANAVEVTGVECREVIYKCRKRKTRELDSFLRHQLYLRLQSSPVQLPKGDVRVSFADAEEAQIAIQMGNVAGGWYFPYSQAPRLAGNMAQKPRNAYAGAGMILGSESVCAPPVSPPAAVVAASVLLVQGGKGGNHFVCSKLTLLPQPLLAAVLAARPSAYLYGTQVGVQLKGEKECCEIDPRLLNVLETVRKLHRGEVAGASDTSTQQVRAAVQKLMTAAEEIARESVPLPTIKRNLQDIPASRFGRIIGKGGSNIQALQKANPKVRIHVPKASEGGSISVEGPEDAVTMACLAIRASL